MTLLSPFARFAAPFLAAALITGPAFAADPFYVTINVSGSRAVEQGFSNIDEAIDQLQFQKLQARTSAYVTGNESLDVGFYLRGLNVSMGFANGSSTLTFDAPQAGLDKVQFVGRSSNALVAEARADAIAQLKDYLKTNKDALKKLLGSLARYSPIDPLAGNPDSLFGQRMRNDFGYGFTNKVSQIWGCSTSAFNFTNDAPIQVASNGGTGDIFAEAQARAASLQAQNEVGIGLLASSTKADVAAQYTRTGLQTTPGGTLTTNALMIPFSYTAKLDSDPGKKIRFDLPLTYITTGGATSYSLGVGLAYTHPVSEVWSLTPSLGFGATGSSDLGSAGGVSSLSLTSAYTWRFDTLALSMGNALAQYKSIGFKIGNVEAAADISNTVYTNGFLLTGPNSMIAKNLVLEYSLIDTRITGDSVYTDSSDEIGIALGHISTDQGVIDSYTKVGLSYVMAKGEGGDINSIRLGLMSRF